MILNFKKYQGAGNDFVLIDNREGKIALSIKQIAAICDRHFGVGADGLMLLETDDTADFKMVYFNADGNESTMCGNGGRCIAAFAQQLGVVKEDMDFIATDGMHHAKINPDKSVSLQMKDVNSIEFFEDHYELDTGSPHYVMFVEEVDSIDILKAGRRIRHYSQFEPKGINVNFVERKNNELHIRTYERGVENETLACGTGVTAAAIAATGKQSGAFEIMLAAKGGRLQVNFIKHDDGSATDVILKGPAVCVFEGTLEL